MQPPLHPRRRPEFLALLLALGATGPAPAALVPTEWAQRQPVPVAAPGLVRLAVPAEVFASAQPGLADLRVLDAQGRELAYFLDRQPVETPPAVIAPPWRTGVRADTVGATTRLVFDVRTARSRRVVALELRTAQPYFFKAAHVEVSPDGEQWESLGAAVPLFRQFGAEQLRVALPRRGFEWVRVTLDDARSAPVPFTGARVVAEPLRAPPPPLVPLGARISRQEEFAGETVLTVALAARHAPLAELELEVADPLFMRRVTVGVREVVNGEPGERQVAAGTLYRVALEGATARAQLELPVAFTPTAAELLVHLHHGDSPPLRVTGVRVRQYQVNLYFLAAAAGTHHLLTGHPAAPAPRYDLAAFAGDLRLAEAASATPGAAEPMPHHAPPAGGPRLLQDVPLTGAPLDARAWRARRPVSVDGPGVQELELDPPALADARADFADLRLLRAGRQLPFILERPALARALRLAAESVPDSQRPSVSVWRVRLPRAALPATRLVLRTGTPLFQRQFHLFERTKAADGSAVKVTLAAGAWSRTPEPGAPATREFALSSRPRTDTLWIESDNGDNPPIALDPVAVVYPVVRLVFQTRETDGLELAYGHPEAGAPRYDLGLVAAHLLTAPRAAARLDGAPTDAAPASWLGGIQAVHVFWVALTLVVVVLLVVVARLLPKPPTT